MNTFEMQLIQYPEGDEISLRTFKSAARSENMFAQQARVSVRENWIMHGESEFSSQASRLE
jgi:hypothetical protein